MESNINIKNIKKYIENLVGQHGKWEIYKDFLEMTAISIRNTVNKVNRQELESRYFEIIKKYTKSELNIFAKMIAEITVALEKEPSDILGQVYMELGLGDSWKGQFFTPQNISDLMAEMTVDKNIDEIIKRDGFITGNDSSVGGGSTLIGLANVMKKKGYNFQKQLCIVCNDIDINSVYMCYIHLSLLGIPAQVMHMDTMSNLEPMSIWNTPFYEMYNWGCKLKNRLEKKKEPYYSFSVTESKSEIKGQVAMI